ncbi:MAG TPA: hypothetical protein VMV26_13740 [Alphaproteobacteria bacterium]|jgi:hypothetical protein|nr:hypothetical protein [Alphaproteobacteria bacterium]
MATVIDLIESADGRTVELTVEPGTIALVVRSPDHERPERAVLSWDEFDQAMDKLRAWRGLVSAPQRSATAAPADEIGTFMAALAARQGGPESA